MSTVNLKRRQVYSVVWQASARSFRDRSFGAHEPKASQTTDDLRTYLFAGDGTMRGDRHRSV
jgi:hypothetical protein